ncbi:hypothetical protein BCR33DRAFT_720140, partial [Rhizoclosmatium globosum]
MTTNDEDIEEVLLVQQLVDQYGIQSAAACSAIARIRRTANQHAQMAANLRAQADTMEEFLAQRRWKTAIDKEHIVPMLKYTDFLLHQHNRQNANARPKLHRRCKHHGAVTTTNGVSYLDPQPPSVSVEPSTRSNFPTFAVNKSLRRSLSTSHKPSPNQINHPITTEPSAPPKGAELKRNL